MSEQKHALPTDALINSSQPGFGPGKAEVEIYKHIIDSLDMGEEIGFSPRVVSELTSTLIDRGQGGCFINPDVGTNGLDDESVMKIATQRYVCGVLGLQVGALEISPSSHTASFSISLPEAETLPALPHKNSEGKFVGENGEVLSDIRGDAIYAAHFIAGNADHFRQPAAFENMFKRVVEQAEAGKIEVSDISGDIKGATSMVRQIARVLGYQVAEFVRDPNTSKFVGTVNGIRPGFDAEHTHFKPVNTNA